MSKIFFQHCLFKVGSYAYPEEDLTFSNGLLKYNNSSFQQATELDYSIEEPIPLRDTRYVWHNHVNLSLTGFEVTLRRHIGKYVVYNHMPSGLFVCVSWISFVVPIEAIPGRMSLLITLLLVLINIFNSSVFTEPLSHGITAVSGWLLSCIFFVFGSLMAYAGLLYKRYWAVAYDSVGTTAPYKPDISANSSADNGQLHKHLNITDTSVHSTVSRRQMDMTLRKMNYWCLLISVALFVLFNIVYWSFVFSS